MTRRKLEDEDGVDGPFDRAVDKAIREDAKPRGRRRAKSEPATVPAPHETLRQVAGSSNRAVSASDADHLAAIAAVACPICGAEPGTECVYGSHPIGTFSGKAHTRRVSNYLTTKEQP